MEKQKPCVECGAFDGHHPLCSLIDLDSAKKQLTQYYKLWLEQETDVRKREAWARKRVADIKKELELWRGKFLTVKQENNSIRKREKKPLTGSASITDNISIQYTTGITSTEISKAYRLEWRNPKTGKKGHGDWMSGNREAVQKIADESNKLYPLINHWVGELS